MKKIKRLLNTFLAQSLLVKIVIIIFAAGLIFGGYKLLGNKNQNKVTYQTQSAEKGTLVVSVSASGSVTSTNNAAIRTNASGVIKKTYVKNGDTVKMGDPIVELELDREGQQGYSQALSSYQSAANSLESAKTNLYTLQSKMFAANQKFMTDAVDRDLSTSDPLYIQENADWLASEATYKNQQNVITQTQSALNSASLSLSDSAPIVYAPISGTVSGLSVTEGTVVTTTTSSSSTSTTSSGTKLGNIVTGATPLISVNLTEIDITSVKTGDKATITLDSQSGKTFTGKVISVDTVGSVSSGVTNYPVVIQLDDAPYGIFPNMSATANIITATKTDVITVPSSAIKNQNGESYVEIMKNGRVENATVTTGLSSGTNTEIVSGVSEGDIVVTNTQSGSTSRASTTSTSPFGIRGIGGAGGNARIAR